MESYFVNPKVVWIRVSDEDLLFCCQRVKKYVNEVRFGIAAGTGEVLDANSMGTKTVVRAGGSGKKYRDEDLGPGEARQALAGRVQYRGGGRLVVGRPNTLTNFVTPLLPAATAVGSYVNVTLVFRYKSAKSLATSL